MKLKHTFNDNNIEKIKRVSDNEL